MDKQVVVVVTPSSRSCVGEWAEELAPCFRHILVFARKNDEIPAFHPQLEGLAEFFAVEEIGDYYAMLNKKLYPFIDAEVPVLFVSAGHLFDRSGLSELIDAISDDPFYGFALPRTDAGGSAPVPVREDENDLHTAKECRNFLEALPRKRSGGVVQGPPVLVHCRVLMDFGRLTGNTYDLSDALAMLFIKANRRGYSAVVSNRVLFYNLEDSPPSVAAEVPRLERASDFYKAVRLQSSSYELLYESLLWHRMAVKSKRTVLFDIRNLISGYNGTAQHILSLLRPITSHCDQYAVDPTFWVRPDAAEFHQLENWIPGRIVFEPKERKSFDATVRLSQPWSFSELRDHAVRSTINVYLMLDTIAWDCLYIRMPHIDGLWRVMADYADGLLFNSEYTRRLFNERFPASRSTPSSTAYCSLEPEEYFNECVKPGRMSESDGEYILVVGNKYYHKGLEQAVEVISSAFPAVKVKVLGEVSKDYHNVEMLPSGLLEESVVDELYCNCKCLVFPSYYEGFGLPVLKALAYGRPIILRNSELVDEIIELLRPIDLIMPFERRTELLRSIKMAIQSQGVAARDTMQPQRPDRRFGWDESAKVILGLLDQLFANHSNDRCLGRLEFFYRMEQADLEKNAAANSDQYKIVFEEELEE